MDPPATRVKERQAQLGHWPRRRRYCRVRSPALNQEDLTVDAIVRRVWPAIGRDLARSRRPIEHPPVRIASKETPVAHEGWRGLRDRERVRSPPDNPVDDGERSSGRNDTFLFADRAPRRTIVVIDVNTVRVVEVHRDQECRRLVRPYG